MDIFFEKIVARKKDFKDTLMIIGLVAAAIVAIVAVNTIQVVAQLGIGFALAVGFIYLAYRLITKRSIEFEYIVTNGDIDIDLIEFRRKRKRVFSANCKDFELLAKASGEAFEKSYSSVPKKLMAASSLKATNAWYFIATYKNERHIVVFEPDERMLGNFKLLIPLKIQG